MLKICLPRLSKTKLIIIWNSWYLQSNGGCHRNLTEKHQRKDTGFRFQVLFWGNTKEDEGYDHSSTLCLLYQKHAGIIQVPEMYLEWDNSYQFVNKIVTCSFWEFHYQSSYTLVRWVLLFALRSDYIRSVGKFIM